MRNTAHSTLLTLVGSRCLLSGGDGKLHDSSLLFRELVDEVSRPSHAAWLDPTVGAFAEFLSLVLRAEEVLDPLPKRRAVVRSFEVCPDDRTDRRLLRCVQMAEQMFGRQGTFREKGVLSDVFG